MILMRCSDDSVSLEVRDANNTVLFASYGNDYDGLEASAEDITRYAGKTVRTVDAFDALLYSLPLWT